jgi:AbrB family looped-hinge helix DNA binding protein
MERRLKRELECGNFQHMVSVVTSKGQVVVPKALRKKYGIEHGTAMEWTDTADGLRVVKLQSGPPGGFVAALRRLGQVPAVARDKRPVLPINVKEE